MKKEVIELEAIWYGGGFHFKLIDDKNGFARTVHTKVEPYNIEDNKIVYFWKNVEKLGIWDWKRNILIGKENLGLLMVVIGH